jgi:effector-binding domain-containing protein
MVSFNGEEILTEGSKPILLKNFQLMFPVVALTEELGATPTWDAEKKELLVDIYNYKLYLTVGSNLVKVSEEERSLSGKVMMKNGVVYAPLDLLNNNFEVSVEWFGDDARLELMTVADVHRETVDDLLVACLRVRSQYEDIEAYYIALDEYARPLACDVGFSMYYEQDYEKGHDVEICIPVTEGMEPITVECMGKQVTIQTRVLEGGEHLSITHLGHFATLDAVWQQIEQYAIDNNVEITVPSREIYLHEDVDDLRKQVTKIMLRIDK